MSRVQRVFRASPPWWVCHYLVFFIALGLSALCRCYIFYKVKVQAFSGGVTADGVETAREPETAMGPEDGTGLLQSPDKP